MLDIKNKQADVQVLLGALVSAVYFILIGLLELFKIDTILDGSLGDLIAVPFLFLSVVVLSGAAFLLFIRKDGRPIYCLSAMAIAVAGMCFYFFTT
jgi:hypothetical protein